jgi:hypothetical protein
LNFVNHQALPVDIGNSPEGECESHHPSTNALTASIKVEPCTAVDYLNAAAILNYAYAGENIVAVNAAENVAHLKLYDERYFVLLYRMVAFFVDNRQSCNIVVSAALDGREGTSCHVRFKVTAGRLSSHAAQQNRSSVLEPKARPKTLLRHVMMLASILDVPLRADLVEQKRSELSFCLDAFEVESEATADEDADALLAGSLSKKLQVLLVSCVESPMANLVQSLQGENCQVTCIRDVVFAWSTVNSVHFDLVFVDTTPGPIRSEVLFREALAERYYRSGNCSMFAFGVSSAESGDRAFSLQEILNTVGFDDYVHDRRFSDCSFKPLSRHQKMKLKVAVRHPVVKFAFCQSKLGEYLGRMTPEGFAKRAHFFIEQLRWAESVFKSHDAAQDWLHHKSELQRLGEFAKNLGANELFGLCQTLCAALQSGHAKKATEQGALLSEMSGVAQSQLHNLIRLIRGPSHLEGDLHET